MKGVGEVEMNTPLNNIIGQFRSASLSLFLAGTLLALVYVPSVGKGTQRKNYWVFLNTGTQRNRLKGVPRETVEKLQAAHIANLNKLFYEGCSPTAGPLGDNGFIRGTVVLSLAKEEELKACFVDDPFVRDGILDADIVRFDGDERVFQEPVTPFAMAEHTLCIVKKARLWDGEYATAKRLEELLPSIEGNLSPEFAVGGRLFEKGERVGVALFYSADFKEIGERLAADPNVVAEQVSVEVHPQYMGKGVLRRASELRPPKRSRSRSLFNGKSFAGWEGDVAKTWRIVNGVIQGGSLTETVPHNAFLATTQEYGDFELRLDVRLQGTGFVNGGIQFRSQRRKSIQDDYEMVGYQADMGAGYWGCLYDESRRDMVLAKPSKLRSDRVVRPNVWNRYVVRCEGSRIRLWLNGELIRSLMGPFLCLGVLRFRFMAAANPWRSIETFKLSRCVKK
jgi:uncharacterized protein YciI